MELDKEMNFFHTTITDETKRNVMACLDSGFLSEGNWVDDFEQGIEDTFGYRNCVAVNSCTSALHLALVLAGVKPGDEVILPAQTFLATGLAVLYCGAKPVFADIEKDTGNISVFDVYEKITEKTKAIVSVSWGGTPPDLEHLQGTFNAIPVIQDNAHALGSTYEGEPIANFGDFSCFSFQAIKQLTSGDGGMLVCRNPHDAYRARKLRWFGIDRANDKTAFDGERLYNAIEVGYKYNMNNIAAAIGFGNLHGVKERQARRKWVADQYDNYQNHFRKIVNVVSREGSSDWLYTMLVEDRDDFIRMMRSKDIPVSVVHNGIDRNSIFGGVDRSLVNQRYWDEHHICLPCHSGLTDEDAQKVCDAVKGGW